MQFTICNGEKLHLWYCRVLHGNAEHCRLNTTNSSWVSYFWNNLFECSKRFFFCFHTRHLPMNRNSCCNAHVASFFPRCLNIQFTDPLLSCNRMNTPNGWCVVFGCEWGDSKRQKEKRNPMNKWPDSVNVNESCFFKPLNVLNLCTQTPFSLFAKCQNGSFYR